MPSESEPTKSDSGRWFDRAMSQLSLLAEQIGRTLQDQARDHAANLARIDKEIRNLRSTLQSVKENADKLTVKPTQCPPECQQRIEHLAGQITDAQLDAVIPAQLSRPRFWNVKARFVLVCVVAVVGFIAVIVNAEKCLPLLEKLLAKLLGQ